MQTGIAFLFPNQFFPYFPSPRYALKSISTRPRQWVNSIYLLSLPLYTYLSIMLSLLPTFPILSSASVPYVSRTLLFHSICLHHLWLSRIMHNTDPAGCTLTSRILRERGKCSTGLFSRQYGEHATHLLQCNYIHIHSLIHMQQVPIVVSRFVLTHHENKVVLEIRWKAYTNVSWYTIQRNVQRVNMFSAWYGLGQVSWHSLYILTHNLYQTVVRRAIRDFVNICCFWTGGVTLIRALKEEWGCQ